MDATAKLVQAEKIVKNYAIASLVPGVLPIPLLDVALVSGVQLKMLQSLASLYETKFSGELGKFAIASLVGGGGSISLAMVAAQLLKPVPIIGQFASLATMTTFGSAATYAVGHIFVQHFESGGTLLTFDATKIRDHYNELLAEVPAKITYNAAGIKP